METNDIKVIFDGFRNIGLCVGLMAGLPVIQNLVPMVCGSDLLRASVVSGCVALILALYIFNLIWVAAEIRGKPSSKTVSWLGFFTVFSIASIAIGWAAFSEVSKDLTVYN